MNLKLLAVVMFVLVGCATTGLPQNLNLPLEVGFRDVIVEGVVTTKPTAFKGAQTGVCIVLFEGGTSAIPRLVTVDMPAGGRLNFGDRVKLEVAEQVGGDVVYHIKTDSIPSEKEK